MEKSSMTNVCKKLSLSGLLSFVVVVVLFLGCGSGEKREDRAHIQINGSDTEVNLVQSLAEFYMDKNPNARIAVTGGGSGTGIAAIINGQTDIANSSRSMRESELEQARERGVEPLPIVFAMDGLAVVTHENNPINSLTIDQVARIYRGETLNWGEVGGPDQAITRYGRQSNSGTYVYFREHVVKGDYSGRMRNMNGTAQIVEAVRNDVAGIGYVGIGYIADPEGTVISRINVVNIAADENSPAVSPLDPENVMSGDYPISRPLYQYTNGMPEGDMLAFIRWELSEEGQQVVARSGYYPVSNKYMQLNRELGIIE
jgi:phosphate transport system substrate-binding protein